MLCWPFFFLLPLSFVLTSNNPVRPLAAILACNYYLFKHKLSRTEESGLCRRAGVHRNTIEERVARAFSYTR